MQWKEGTTILHSLVRQPQGVTYYKNTTVKMICIFYKVEKQKLSIIVLDMFKIIVSVPLPILKGNCHIPEGPFS